VLFLVEKKSPRGAGESFRSKSSEQEVGNDAGHSDEPEGSRERMNKRQTWVRADKLQPGDRVQDANGNVVTIKDVSKGLFPGSILITLQDANPDFAYLESDTKIFVE
jgi:hypothetical protein